MDHSHHEQEGLKEEQQWVCVNNYDWFNNNIKKYCLALLAMVITRVVISPTGDQTITKK